MKRLLFFICTLLCANVLMAQTWFWIDSLQYEVTSTNPAEVEVYDANYSITTANIPATVTYQGTDYSVTSIGEEAFRVCSNLTSVTIPNSVTSIGEKAFMYCRSLTSVTIPNSVTTIGRYTFYNCSSLTSVTIPNSVTSIGYVAFAYCSSLTSVTIPNSVTSIGISAFKECSSLTSIDIPNSVTSIGGSAFDNCSSLTSVTIPNSVTSIGNYAFERCSSLTSVTIPNSVTSIGNYAFSFCSSLTSVILPNNANISSSAFESTGGIKVGGISYGGKETVNIGNYTFNNVGFITFYLNGNATTITPSEVSVIDCDESLSGDIVISSILSYQGINIAVTSIGDEAFEFCSSLTSVTIPNSVTSIGGSAFDNCSSLTSITIPNSVTSIGNSVFWNCSSLTSVTIPNSVTSIGNYAFGYCSSLYSVTIPNSVTSIGDYAFNHCSSLTSVTCLKETAPSLGSSVFFITPSTKVLNIPCGSNYSSWESATDWASVECTWNLGNSLTYFPLTFAIISGGERTMKVRDCDTSATVVEIPARVMYNGVNYSVTSIENYAFQSCSSLTSVTIPNSVTSIGINAFAYCSSLTSINIPNSVTYIEGGAFKNCSSLTSITIPNSVTSIGNDAFYNCSSLTSVTIGNSVTSIGTYAFRYCYDLTSVDIPNSVTSIGNYAFQDCSSLTSVTIPNSVTSIRIGTFWNCSSLTSVTIPNSVTSIGNSAFYNCSSLISVTIPNSVTSIEHHTFSYCSSLTSVTIPNNVTSIGNYAFSVCNNLTSVTIGNSVTSISDYAFYDCSSLTSVDIPNSVTSIGKQAFGYCDNLTSVTCLAETAPSLGNNVFSSTPSNKTLTVPFNASGYTSDWGNATWQKIYHKINEGEIKTLTNAFEITEDNKRGVINEGVLRITQSGQLINQTETNVGGIIEIETPTLANDKWSFIGAPFNNYKLEVVKPGTKDISISLFDYTTGNWAEDFATIDDSVGSGEGFFAWSFAAEPTVFTTYGDGAEVYDFSQLPAYKINNGAVNVTKNLTTNAEGGNWLALSNPYTFKLDVEKFLSEHDSIKGGVVYRFNGSVWTPVSEGEINMTEGFFVNFENPGTHSVSFSKYYIYEPAKSKAIEAKDYITLNVAEGENVSKLRFAQNPKAKQGDDIFDANKLFSPLEITEPYFVTDGVALVKEEVKEYPYTATLNIRNYETKEITLSIDNIPEGLNVYLIDNGYEVKMNGGVEYNTRIIAGENADRFKVLFKKQHRLEKIKDNQISITNNNRQISVKSDKTDLNIEVYNQLGQKVFSTNEYNFTLSEQPAGSYVIKAYQGRFSESKKIVIE